MLSEEDKALLLTDLSGRLPYNVKVQVTYYGDFDFDESIVGDFVLNEIDTRYPENIYWIGGPQLQESGNFQNGTTSFATPSDEEDEVVKPYLRPMSSMTDEEFKEYESANELDTEESAKALRTNLLEKKRVRISSWYHGVDWLNRHHFDYRGLIEKGLALEAPEGMYNFDDDEKTEDKE